MTRWVVVRARQTGLLLGGETRRALPVAVPELADLTWQRPVWVHDPRALVWRQGAVVGPARRRGFVLVEIAMPAPSAAGRLAVTMWPRRPRYLRLREVAV